MRLDVVGKNGFQPSEAIKSYISKKLQKLENFLKDDEKLEARVVCKVYNDYHKVEVTVPTKLYILRAEVSDSDMYAAIDLSIDKLVTQYKRHKEKAKHKMDKKPLKEAFDNNLNIEALEKEVIAKQLVRNKVIELVPMEQEEAINQMELLGHSFFVYLDIKTNRTNVIYLREDGNYAIIETT